MDAAARQAAGKVAELYVFGELLKRGVIPYLPRGKPWKPRRVSR